MATDLYSLNSLATTLQIGSSLVDIWNTGQAGAAAQSLAKWQSMQAEEYGRKQAELIRQRGAEVKGAAVAQMAAQGVDATVGTGAVLIDEIVRSSEKDAFAAVLEGKQRGIALEAQGKMAGAQAKAAQAKSIFNLSQSAIGGMERAKRIKDLTGKEGSLFGMFD